MRLWACRFVYHEEFGRLDAVYPAVTVIHDTLQTNAHNYVSKLREHYEWIHVCAHSSSYASYFNVNGSYTPVTTHDIQAIDPTTLFYNLFACSNCRYTSTNYMGGRYIFTPTYGLAAVGSTKTGSMLYFSDFYSELGKRVRNNLGDAYKVWFDSAIPSSSAEYYEYMRSWFYGMTLLGDPTLTISPPIAQINSI